MSPCCFVDNTRIMKEILESLERIANIEVKKAMYYINFNFNIAIRKGYN